MKIIILIMFVLTNIYYAQSYYIIVNDSLKANPKIVYLGRNSEIISITSIDTGTVNEDTIAVYGGTINYNYKTYPATIIDTVWYQLKLRDASNETQDYIYGGNTNTRWLVWGWHIELLKFQWKNSYWLDNRRWKFIIESRK